MRKRAAGRAPDTRGCTDTPGRPAVALDKKLMTQVVPWIPYFFSNYVISTLGPNVTKGNFDQFGGTPAYAHVAVKT